METSENRTLSDTKPDIKTPMPLIAGILTIVSGAFKFISLLAVAGAFMFVPVTAMNGGFERVGAITVLLAVIIPLAILAILSIIGGIYAIVRRRFGMALTGAIAALLPFSLLGVASLVLIVLAKDEFE